MTLINEYQKYREVMSKLSSEITNSYLEKNMVMRAVDLLGIKKKGETIVFESEWELHILNDFIIHEMRKKGKTPIETYKEEVGSKNLEEKKVLQSFLSSRTSLFKVNSIDTDESSLMLKDLLTKEEDEKLIDNSLSRSVRTGYMLFTRLCPISNFNMTSGICFAFPSGIENDLISQYNGLKEKIDSEYGSVKKYASFFKLYREKGMEVQYVDLDKN